LHEFVNAAGIHSSILRELTVQQTTRKLTVATGCSWPTAAIAIEPAARSIGFTAK
jgi:hypothetical protein